MKNINILELESSKGWGGQEKRTVRLNNNLDAEIFWAVSKESELFKRQNEIKGKFFAVEIRKTYDLMTIWQVVKIIKKYDIDIISTHSGKDAWIGAIAGKITGKKVVRTRHLLTPINSPTSYNLSDKIVCVSKQVKEYLASRGVKKEKLQVIYTGIDTKKFTPSIKKDLKKELGIKGVLIGVVAVLRAAKRHKDLLYAVKDLNVKLAIIGDGPQKENLEKLIKDLNIQNKIFMLGHRDDVAEILPSLDIFVLPSSQEALGTSILEASACGVSVVASNVGGIPECVEKNKSGLLFESQNVKDLREKLKILIENEKLRKEFGKYARKMIEEKFSVERMVKDTKNLYEELA